MVHFVGAGSGACDLITLRGKQLLEEADAVIYAGSLVNPALLGFCRKDARIYNSAELTLEEIIDIIRKEQLGTDGGISEGRESQTVRLHTGDPSLYGAIREQMDAMDKLGIAYDITPGVSAFSAAAASLKAEYTLPGISQTLIITRMQGRTGVPERERLQSLAMHGASMAIYLSASLTREVEEALLSGAYTADTPVAIVYKASWPEERVVKGVLGNLHQMAEENGISKTAIILVGDFLNADAPYENSQLYDPEFSTAYRKGTEVMK